MHVTMNTIGERISCWQAGLQPSQLLRAGSQQGYCHARDPSHGLLPRVWPRPRAAGSVALPWQWASWGLRQERDPHGDRRWVTLAWQGGPVSQEPRGKPRPATFPCLLPPGLPLAVPGGLPRTAVQHRQKMAGAFLRGPPEQPPAHSLSHQSQRTTRLLLPGKPTPHPALALSDCPLLAMSWFFRGSAPSGPCRQHFKSPSRVGNGEFC